MKKEDIYGRQKWGGLFGLSPLKKLVKHTCPHCSYKFGQYKSKEALYSGQIQCPKCKQFIKSR